MGQSFDASIIFGVVVPEDYIEEHYPEADDPQEAFEETISEHTRGTNLDTFLVGYYGDGDTTRTIFGLKEPQVETGYGADSYYCVAFDPKRLDVGVPTAHPEAMRITEVLGLPSWATASWQLCWSVS